MLQMCCSCSPASAPAASLAFWGSLCTAQGKSGTNGAQRFGKAAGNGMKTDQPGPAPPQPSSFHFSSWALQASINSLFSFQGWHCPLPSSILHFQFLLGTPGIHKFTSQVPAPSQPRLRLNPVLISLRTPQPAVPAPWGQDPQISASSSKTLHQTRDFGFPLSQKLFNCLGVLFVCGFGGFCCCLFALIFFFF